MAKAFLGSMSVAKSDRRDMCRSESDQCPPHHLFHILLPVVLVADFLVPFAGRFGWLVAQFVETGVSLTIVSPPAFPPSGIDLEVEDLVSKTLFLTPTLILWKKRSCGSDNWCLSVFPEKDGGEV